MKASGVSLVDANVWLALAVDAHFHHATAKAWFEGQPDESCAGRVARGNDKWSGPHTAT